MMMKIFGAALIVSGGFFIGKLHNKLARQRLEALTQVQELFEAFYAQLRDFRRGADDFFVQYGGVGKKLCSGEEIVGLRDVDQSQLNGVLCQVRSASYQESLGAVADYCNRLEQQIKSLREELQTTGRAISVMSCAAALLMAIVLF